MSSEAATRKAARQARVLAFVIATVLLLVLEGFLLWTVVFPGLGSPDFDYIPFFVALIPIAIADFVVLLVFSVYVLR